MQILDDLRVDLFRPQMPERLNDRSFGAPGTSQRTGRGMMQLDGLSASLDAAGSSIGQIDGAGRNLRGKPQRIGRLRSGALETASCIASKGSGDLVEIGRHRAEDRVEPE